MGDDFVEDDGCDGSEEDSKSYPYDPISRMLDEFENESDRGIALIGAAFLEEALENRIRSVMIDQPKKVDALFERDGPLATFSAKISIANCLGLLEPDVYADLELIRKIRNVFAHQHQPASFELPEIRDRCLQLRSIKRLPPLPSDVGWRPTARNRFRLAANLIPYWLRRFPAEVKRPDIPTYDLGSSGWDDLSQYDEVKESQD